MADPCYNSVIAHFKLWASITAQFYLVSKREYFEAWGQGDPKDAKRREKGGSILAPLFICFFSFPLCLPYANWASQEGCLFHLMFSFWSSGFPLFYFQRFCLYLSFQFITQFCLTLCDPMNYSMPGLPVHHQLPKINHTHVHRVGDAIQPSHSLSSPSSPAPNPSQHQSLFMTQQFHL